MESTNIPQFSILIFTDFNTVKAMQPILIREFSFQLILEFPSQYWKKDIPMHCSFFFFFTLITVSNHNCDTLGDECFESIFCTSGIEELQSEFCLLLGSLSQCYWNTSLVLTQEDCCCRRFAFRGGRDFRHRGDISVPKHTSRFVLRFNVIRIL